MSTSDILICGSIAYDNIMVFEGRFRDHILPEQVHILNVAFLVPTLRKQWGGCAGNIAYGLKLLGGSPVPMATVGQDGSDYLHRLNALGISSRCVRMVDDSFTAQAFITTDLDDNQITAFHPGAMSHSHLNQVSDAGAVKLAIIAPDGRDGMIGHARQLAEAGIPFIFDPGQGLPMFSGDELLQFLEQARYAAVNDYEARMLTEKTGLDLTALAQRVEALVVTRGAEGAWVFEGGQRHDIPCVKAEALVDPTGCGDAFRAGLLFGLSRELDLPTCARLGSVMGSLKIAHRGGQGYSTDPETVVSMFKHQFGYAPW